MDISFYDFDFNRLADFNRFMSFNAERNYCGYGTAEIHFSFDNIDIINLLENNQYIFFVANNCSAIVTGYKITEDIAVYGRTCEWLLTKRGVNIFSYENQNIEELTRNIVSSSAGDFVTLDNIVGIGEDTSFAIDKVRNLHDVVCEILNTQKLGFKLEPSIKEKQFIFSVYSGKKQLVTLSPSNRTAYDMSYVVENQDTVTRSGWYERKLTDLGEWNASNNTPRISNNTKTNAYTYYKVSAAGTQFGITFAKGDYVYSNDADGKLKKAIDKPENVWVYIDNTAVSGAKKWDAVLTGAKTESEAMAEIDLLSKDESLTAETKDVEYGIDYFLGDIVRVQFEAGSFKKAEEMRVTSIDMYFDVDKSGFTPKLSKLEE